MNSVWAALLMGGSLVGYLWLHVVVVRAVLDRQRLVFQARASGRVWLWAFGRQLAPLRGAAVVWLGAAHLAATLALAYRVRQNLEPWELALWIGAYLALTMVLPLYVLWRLPLVRALWEQAPTKLLVLVIVSVLAYVSKGTGQQTLEGMFGTSAQHFPMATIAATVLDGIAYVSLLLLCVIVVLEVLALAVLLMAPLGWKGSVAPMALLLYVGLAMGVLPIFGLITNQWVAKVLVAQIAWEWDGVAATHCGAVAGAAGVAPGTPSQRVVFLDGAPDKAMLFEAGQPVGGKPFRKWTKDDFKQSKPRFLRMVACHAG